MDGYFGIQEIRALQNLIAPRDDNSEDDDELVQKGSRKKLGPGNIEASDSEKLVTPHAPLKSENNEIWNPLEINDGPTETTADPRIVPEYDMKFKQSVTSEDVFLGMGFKTPSSASCKWLSVFVKMPGDTMDQIELSVESEYIDIRSPKYRLHLETPHSVDPNESSAKWHNDTSTLELTLKLCRELDGINF